MNLEANRENRTKTHKNNYIQLSNAFKVFLSVTVCTHYSNSFLVYCCNALVGYSTKINVFNLIRACESLPRAVSLVFLPTGQLQGRVYLNKTITYLFFTEIYAT